MEKIVYYDVEKKKFITELDVRHILFDFEMGDIYNNIDDYCDKLYDLESQLDIVRSAIYGDINNIITRLKRDWNIEIKKYKEVE